MALSPSKFDLVIFDCDGTLVDSETLNNQATLDVLDQCGVQGYTLDHAFHHWMGTTYTSIALRVQMETGKTLPDNFVQRCIARVSELQDQELKAVKGAAELIDTLIAMGIPSCVASNGERTNVINSIRLTGLSKYYDEDRIFTKIQVERPKPAPDIFLFAADKMGVAPDRCVVIEDSEAGVTAAVAAGMRVIGFTGTSHDKTLQGGRLAKAGANPVMDDFIHIPDLLGR